MFLLPQGHDNSKQRAVSFSLFGWYMQLLKNLLLIFFDDFAYNNQGVIIWLEAVNQDFSILRHTTR